MKHHVSAFLLFFSFLASGCVVNLDEKDGSAPPLNHSLQPIPDDEVLDVGVAILNPGIDELDDDQLIFPEARRAEATFIANELAKTLQDVGAWGAVRVVPDERQFTDLLVTGRILHSDGEHMALAVRVSDARGIIWIDKRYEGITSKYAYEGRHANSQDPFLMVYRQIANDLLRVFSKQSRAERVAIRQIAELRFARAFASDAFSDYLSQDKNGIYRIQRLPAVDDPMLQRVRNLRQRNYVFVDTLQRHYSNFSDQMYDSYQYWRKSTFEERVSKKLLNPEYEVIDGVIVEQSDLQIIAGIGAVLAGATGNLGDNGGNFTGIAAGGAVLKDGMNKRRESQMFTQALGELGDALEAEITPRVIELEDRTVRLSGNVDDQYAQWRELMADIYAAEIGALAPPVDEVLYEDNTSGLVDDTIQQPAPPDPQTP